MPLPELLDAFASDDPVPGGGSAAALAGALGASLLLMVAAMPKTRTGAPGETAALAEAAARLQPIRDGLLALVDRDSEAYLAVVAAFRLPKATDEEKAARRAAIQAGTLTAAEVPLETMRLCQAALREVPLVGERGNPNASSDVGVAAELLRAARRGARLNVDINLASLSDAGTAASLRARAEEVERD
jgi:glutamate formiminotransferase/formiminotetrahydrofolate cyclodeaminase